MLALSQLWPTSLSWPEWWPAPLHAATPLIDSTPPTLVGSKQQGEWSFTIMQTSVLSGKVSVIQLRGRQLVIIGLSSLGSFVSLRPA